MGATQGHVSVGFAFFVIGLWHLFSCIKLHAQHPKSYITMPWFPLSKTIRYLELILIMGFSAGFVSMEILIGREPLDPDGTIRAKYLRHFEHSTMSMSFFVYAFFAILFDKIAPRAQHGLMHLLQAIAFGQQLLILHLHSTDHMGVEGQYHWLLQIVTFVSLFTTILAIGYPNNFLNGFTRAFSILFQGVWLIVTGIMVWTPDLIPKGCFLKSEAGHDVVLCHDDRTLERAKALVNLQFGWYVIGLTMFSTSLYLVLIKLYPEEKVEYQPLTKYEREEERYNVEAQKKSKICQSRNSLPF
ncbi:unnamed protein product [Fraxinus pennsylvanica]|uniref:Transmembrane protein 45A n=1 Tax=Fraxinus pennsylvanica TaxID=56036 RepID=A0AAD2DSU5_9LAMI|nr:unnamed protein product [Fraxinus pennsylvanica]